MTGIRRHYRNTDIRKAGLDQSTFGKAPDWVRDCPCELDRCERDGRLTLAAYTGALLFGGLFWWAVWTLVKGVM